MSKRRVSELSLNFDSMTDLITNLAGGLLLLVLLLLGITRPAASQSKPIPPAPGTSTAAVPALPVEKRVALLRGEVRKLEQEIQRLEEPLRQAREETEKLLDKLSSLQPTTEPPVKIAEAGPMRFEYRPPLLKQSSKVASIAIVCQDRRISVCDIRFENTEHFVIPETPRPGDRVVSREGDFDAIVGVDTLDRVERKPGHDGVPLEEAIKPDSTLSQLLDNLDPSTQALQYVVYSDSFETFRELRTQLASRGFESNWLPREHGAAIPLGSSGGTGIGTQ